MRQIKYFFLTFLFVLVLVSCNYNQKEYFIEFSVAEGFPTWLKDAQSRTDQTSGITFIGYNEFGDKTFLVCDDMGDIHRISISNKNQFSLKKIVFTEEVNNYLTKYPKLDFEEIVFDKKRNEIYLSIEGNSERGKNNYKEFNNIYKLNFSGNSPFSDTLVSLNKIDFKPKELFEKFLGENFGYEGMAIDDDYIYLALEGFADNNIFADSTIIFIVDKNNFNIIKEISTKVFGIHTICGLFAEDNKKLWGVDRNNRKIFYIEFNKDFSVNKILLKDIPISIPGFPEFEYVAAIESICMDDEKNLYLVDDPWKRFYIPQGELAEKLDSITLNNFKEFIPIIYKFNSVTISER